jgi:hypothetical protein
VAGSHRDTHGIFDEVEKRVLLPRRLRIGVTQQSVVDAIIRRK